MASVPNTFTASTVAQSSQVNANFTALSNVIKPTFEFSLFGTVAVANSVTPIAIVPLNLTIIKAYLAIKTAPVGAALIVDMLVNGTSIWNSNPSNRVQIADGATTGTQTSFDTTTLADGDLLTVNIIQVGSGTPGSDLTIALRCEWR